jgi:hypothetical protein
MSTRTDDGQARIRALRRRAASEQRMAARAAAAASAEEALASSGVAGGAGGVHAAAAAVHRDAEAFHLMVAEMAELQAARMVRWLAGPSPAGTRPRLVAVAAAMLGTPSASVTIWSGCDRVRLSASDATAKAACECEAITAQGPGTDAWSTGQSCAAAGERIADRWPLYAQAVAALGVRGVVAAPLGPGAAGLGAICAYYRSPAVSSSAVIGAGQVAAALTRLLLHDAVELAPLLAEDYDLAVIQQAVGMVSVQAGCTISQADDLLAARAYADSVPLIQAAATVLSGETRFQPVGKPGRDTPPEAGLSP